MKCDYPYCVVFNLVIFPLSIVLCLVFLFHFHDVSLKLENWFGLAIFPTSKTPIILQSFNAT